MSRTTSQSHEHTGSLLPLALTALGVVFGDIGTSPLYTIRECFFGLHPVPPTQENVLGVLSLIIYALVVVISIKYVAVVMRADNEGEGGILALTSLIPRARTRPILIGLGIFGAALLYGDGMITPAITVLSAVEGLRVVTPFFDPYVIPATAVIIAVIFGIQSRGTDKVGRLFGPVMIIWFASLAALGIPWILEEPTVLLAFDPRHAITLFSSNGFMGFAVLGAVVLAVTGGEALYADMGHFGRGPIRLSWFSLVFPALIVNYLGQGAIVLQRGEVATQPFFMLSPTWALVPLVVLSTLAAIIASQALISGVFSLTHQAVQLGYCPRLDIDHTSSEQRGQVYVPQANWALMTGALLIVVGFRSSSALAAAYGVAVTLTMVITAILLHVVTTERWHWKAGVALFVTGVFLTIDFAFFSANLLKLLDGGWLPIVIAVAMFTLMTTWKTGRRILAERVLARAIPLDAFMMQIAPGTTRVPGTAVFMTAQARGTPPALVHNLRHNKVLHERVIVLTVQTTQIPHVPPQERLVVGEPLGQNVFNAQLQYGFMDEPNVPEALSLAGEYGIPIDPDDVTYFLGRETVIVTDKASMATWREKLFVLMARNAVRATAFFKLPPEHVVELGVQVEM